MTTYFQFLGRFYISNSLKDFSVDGTALSLTTGYYYINQYSGEVENQLCEHMQEVIRAGTAFAGATVTYSGTTGFVTINIGSTVDVVFTDTDLAALMGFSATTQSGASSYTGDQFPQHTWRPSIAASDFHAESSNFWAGRSTTRINRSANGTTYSVMGNLIYDGFVSFDILPKADVIVPITGTIHQDFTTWWISVIHEGQPFRVFSDRTLNLATSFKTGVFGDDGTSIVGSIDDLIARYTSEYNGQWSVNIPIMEYNV